MRTNATHPCDLCPTQISNTRLMCLAHWRLVPKALQAEVNATWRKLHKPGTHRARLESIAAYRKARSAAVAAVGQLLTVDDEEPVSPVLLQEALK